MTTGPRRGNSILPRPRSAHLKRLMPRAPAPLVEESVRHGLRQTDDGRYTWKYDPAFLSGRRSRATAVDLWSVVKSIPTPTLLQYGSHSDVVKPRAGRAHGRDHAALHRGAHRRRRPRPVYRSA